MAIKVKITKSLTLKTLIPDISKNMKNKTARDEVVREIKEHINAGKSPVKGFKFRQYSDSYSEIKGKKKPVDMKVSGKMLDSLTSKTTIVAYRIVFESLIADYHNRLGASVAKVVRRLLPTARGERFAKGIEDKIIKSANRATKKATDKQNR